MNATDVKNAATSFGADKVRIADLKRLHGIETSPPDLLSGMHRAVSIAVRLSEPVIGAVKNEPTPLYASHYQMVNRLLDDIAVRLTVRIQKTGATALPLPASQVLDSENLTSYISHKAVAVAAGIGWQGKSLLAVSPEYGPRIRLVTVLTDLDIEPDSPLKNRCGSCTACAEACPAGAIKNVNTDSHYTSRDQALYFERCRDKLTRDFRNRPHIGASICGVCITVCPWGRKKNREGVQ